MPNISVLRTKVEDVKFGAMVCPMNTYFDTAYNGCSLYQTIKKRGGENLFRIAEYYAAEYYLRNMSKMEMGYLGFVEPGHTLAIKTKINLPQYILFSAVFTISKKGPELKPKNLIESSRNVMNIADQLDIIRVNFPVIQTSTLDKCCTEYIESVVNGVSLNGTTTKVKEICFCLQETDEEKFGKIRGLVDALQKS